MSLRPAIQVPQPCSESWAAMTPAAQGRHCAACNKVVVDFTRMTDAELLAYLGQAAGTTCGRFRAQQVNRPLAVPVAASPGWRRPVLALAALLGFGAAATSAAQAQVAAKPTPAPHTITLGMVTVPQPAALPSLPRPILRGVVRNSVTREPMPGVTVLLAGTTIGVATGTDGTFELQLPEAGAREVTLQFTDVGYRKQEQRVTLPQTNALQVLLAPDGQMLSGEVVVMGGISASRWYSPRNLWWRLTRPFRP
ncbi:carboxypeptidase-like regulatory domain-containing protein [Hymenobacter sp. HSC-4F20]|uniref:carboxypeptidase-like regulatory domain-containing protein n=1 Tax=Hymenobacter sp. HSC-4F20 TaxID=2864135 RepID=UPI001C733BAF|nr:carboxypeptidase-like regulatory domain-containing protein [Hymenobacter sp. HSC-4F20]MBX0292513.1 carboxypeptidase-like regulatory domain-containing protein [Hymenobacter sp. HSC-4F20]